MPPIADVRARLRAWSTQETAGGIALIAAAGAALLWANSPFRDSYANLVETRIGPAALGLDLTLGAWASEGLLAIFFFVVGVELKHELRVGSLRNVREAAVPMLAAVGGMVGPAILYVVVVLASGAKDALVGWPIPTATDIAFALGALAIFGRGLPAALRTFLLTLAVVDDLLAILVLAVFFTQELRFAMLGAALAGAFAFRLIVVRTWARWWSLLPIAFLTWWFMHESGVHATVAGVLLGFCVPALALHGEQQPRTVTYEHAVRPLSSTLAVPAFAFLTAGVTVTGVGLTVLFGSPIAHGVLAGLLAGKVLGVLVTTAVVTRVTPMRLPPGIGVRDLLGIGFLTGIGFTVSLLMAELSFGGSDLDSAKASVLLGSVLAVTAGAVSLRWDARRPRSADMNRDGFPDDIAASPGAGAGASDSGPSA